MSKEDEVLARATTEGPQTTDSEEYGVEWDALLDQYEQLRRKPVPPITVYDKSIANKWKQLSEKQASIAQYNLSQMVSKDEAGVSKPADTAEKRVIKIGAALIYLQSTQALINFANSEGLSSSLRPSMELETFMFARNLMLRINGFAIADFVDQTKLKKIPLEELFGYLADVMIKGGIPNSESNLDTDSSSLGLSGKLYPTIVRNAVGSVAINLAELLNCRPAQLRKIISSNSGNVRDAAMVGERLSQNFQSVRENIFKNLINPDLPSSEAIRVSVQNYLRLSNDISLRAIHLAGVSDPSHAVFAHREAIKLVSASKDPEFYGQIATKIKSLIEANGSIIPTKEDASLFMADPEIVNDLENINFEDLASLVKDIFSKSSHTSYDVPPTIVEFVGLVTPESMVLNFNKLNPLDFEITINFGNEFGEITNIWVKYNLKKGEMDWSFLESTNNPDTAFIKKAFLLSAWVILSGLREQTKQTYEKRKDTTNETSSSYSPKRSQLHYIPDEWRKEFKRDEFAKQLETQFSLDLITDVDRTSGAAIERHIIIPSDEEIIIFMENLGTYDRETVLNGITEYNERGVGSFTRKRAKDEEGEPIYTLRVNTQVPGGVRVLLREVNSTKGHRYFEIVDIRYRKDIYRKNRI